MQMLTEAEAAQIASVSIRILQTWRGKGRGPRFTKVGRAVRYNPEILKDWLRDQTVQSTAEADALEPQLICSSCGQSLG